MIKLRKYIRPINASDEVTESDLLSYLGVDAEAPATEEVPETETTEPATETPEVPATESTAPAVETPATPEVTQPAVAPNKQNQAFAQMRTQNTQLNGMVKDLASILGIDSKDPNEIQAKVQDAILTAQAKTQGIPVETLRKLGELEEKNYEYSREANRRQAYLGFQAVKDTFSLNDAALNTFADTLVAEGLNPFDGGVDVVSEYKVRNFDKLIQDAVDRGIREEQQRATKAQSSSTMPSKQRGDEPAEPKKINSMQDLANWMAEVGTK